MRESAYVCLNNDAHHADRFRVSCPEWETSINDPFCKKAKEDATVANHQRYRRPVIVVNGFRFKVRSKRPRSNGLCFALVLDLLGRTPESISSVLFDNDEAEQIDIPAQTGVHSGYVATKQAVLYLLHLCPCAFASALQPGGERPPMLVSAAAQPQLLALPHYNRLELGDITFRPKFTQATGRDITRPVASKRVVCVPCTTERLKVPYMYLITEEVFTNRWGRG